ncbi:histone mRNA hairpin-binding protein [Cryptosporidium ubiquitum]|uniref:Histone mRNA hairpin-binding protein n=1 Tax=Cryptosporidium ubiquitum TaxID=857276 RepID=A0A1J4MFR7_9CRYT|nr:histone mRNA hairpin-binding protein [Cryptosporidium ubiquitum]OII73049.1 histone mRNA hairpin-binding protein [Cryptosporidium ubiquitum]
MTENSTREKSVVSKHGWGAVRWADLSISDASNSWIQTQSDTKNESKSIGLTSLLQKNIKLNDSISEYQGKKTIKESTIKVKNRGFLTINSTETNNEIGFEKSDFSSSLGRVGSKNYEEIEKDQNIESQEFRFGEGTYPGSLTDISQTDQTIKCLIQDANLNSPKVFGSLPQILTKDSYNNNKKRIKDYNEKPEDSENINFNSETQIDQLTIYKKVKHSKTNTCTTENPKLSRETNQNAINERNTQKKMLSNQLSTPKRQKNILVKSPIVSTPKTPQFNSSHRNNDFSVDISASSNIDWNKRISSRLFQIAIGKGTRAYQNFLRLKPRKEDREPNDPQTPNAHIRCPQKQFTDQLNQWRKSLHQYDDLDSSILEL